MAVSASPHILVAEDDAVCRKVARSLLEVSGYRVQQACDGAEVLELCAKHSFDVILMDCGLPDRDGYEVTGELRRRGVSTPILALSGDVTTEARQRSRECGMNGFLQKPLQLPELVAALEEVCGLREAVSRRRLDEMWSLNPGVTVDIIDSFLKSFPADLARMRECTDPDEARRLCHRLRGAAVTIGAERLQQLLAEGTDEETASELQRVLAWLEGYVRPTESP